MGERKNDQPAGPDQPKPTEKGHEKGGIGPAPVWIFLYLGLVAVGEALSDQIGLEKSGSLPILLLLSLLLYYYVRKKGMEKEYGLCPPAIPASKMLYYLPLLLLTTANLWYGPAWNFSGPETLFYILFMLCVGFLEELIFRGFLFRALAKDGIKPAMIISALTFGMGHILNLLLGAEGGLLLSLLQVVYATAFGFAFVLVFYRSGSLLPCILTHGLFNALSVFANEASMTDRDHIVLCLLTSLLAGGYALYLALGLRERTESHARSSF